MNCAHCKAHWINGYLFHDDGCPNDRDRTKCIMCDCYGYIINSDVDGRDIESDCPFCEVAS